MNAPRDSRSVLFVDDEPMIRKYFERSFGHEMHVITASDGEQARAVLEACGDDIAVLMTDQRMPVGDGITLLNEAKLKHPNIVRLLTTAYSDIEQAIAAVNEGEIWRYITKPWDLKTLRETLYKAIDVYRARTYEQALLIERRRAILMVASYMAHEMRTPLRSIHAIALGTEQYLATLLEGYDWAIQHGADIQPLTKRHRAILGKSSASVQRIADRANTVIDLLLANAGAHRIDPAFFERCAITDCLTAALDDFPFTEQERTVVQWETGDDFSFHGSVNLLILVLHNLLRNALRAVAATGSGTIRIWTKTDRSRNFLHIKDTGTGIPEELLPRIFDDFTSFSNDGRSAGIGLSFCRRVIISFGGEISCSSKNGEYTQFDLWFPVILDDG